MNLSPMRYKNYVWPHNPRVYETAWKRDIAVHRIPFGPCLLQNMGRQHRVLAGEGEFSGENAYANFAALAEVFRDSEPGVLVHPVWGSSTAYFAALKLQQEPAENYVKYAFEFWECGSEAEGLSQRNAAKADDGRQEFYTLGQGESFWSAAAKLGLDAGQLIGLNPGMKNPNLLKAGDSIRVK